MIYLVCIIIAAAFQSVDIYYVLINCGTLLTAIFIIVCKILIQNVEEKRLAFVMIKTAKR